MNDDRIDFSSLDPSRDLRRWDQLVVSLASRAIEARRRQFTISRQLVAWARPVLAIAATVALGIWAGALLNADRKEATTASSEDPVYTLAGWAIKEQVPSTTEILKVLGEQNGTP
jgi:hypothetical protein